MREFWKVYNQKPKRQIYLVKYHNEERNLGSKFLNVWFAGSECHHINQEEVIFIPKELHKEVKHNLKTGEGMQIINTLAIEFLERRQ